MDQLGLIKKLLGLVEHRSDKVPREIACLIKEHYDLIACSFYSFESASPDELILLGQSGLPEQAFESISLPCHNSVAGRCLAKQCLLIIDDNMYKQEPLLKNLDPAFLNSITGLIAIPLTAEEVDTSLNIGNNSYYGALYLYFSERHKDKLETIKNSLESLAFFVSDVYLRSVVHDRILLIQEVVDYAFSANDLNSFLYKTLDILKKNWGIEAASVYMLNERTQTLQLSSTTGLADKTKKKEIVFLSLKKGRTPLSNCVLNCFEAGKIGFSKDMTGEPEAIGLTLRSIMTVPVFHPAQDAAIAGKKEKRRVIGVLKCINRVVQQSERVKDSCRFGFADQDRMNMIADFIGVVAILFWRVMHIYEDFERTVHGVLNNVVTLRASLGSLERNGGLDLRHTKYNYVIPDSIKHLDALKWQIEKFSNRDRKPEIKLQKVWVKDVIKNALQIARPLAHYFNVKGDIISEIDYEKLRPPAVHADPDLLVTVFRNLIENSIKYAHRDGQCKISIWWEDAVNAIKLYVEDNGIGVDEEDEEDQDLIFSEGYRTEEAIRWVTSGASAGLGLYQCRTIMHEMNGDIELSNNRNNTTFCLTIPKE